MELQRIYYVNEDFMILNDLSHLSIIEDSKDKWMRVLACLDGELTATIDGRVIKLQRNDILFISSEQHIDGVMVSTDFKFIMFALSKQIKSEIFPSSAIVWQTFHHIRETGKITLQESEVEDLKIDILYLCHCLPACGDLFYNDYIRCIIQALIYRITAKLAKVGNTGIRNFMQSPETLSEAFFNLLNSTYPTPRSVDWYAMKLNKTPKYLSTVIRRTSGKKPMEWITEKTVNEIANLLKNSKKSIKEISAQLNFSSLSFFCRYVRQHLGVSPNQYRSYQQRSHENSNNDY